MVMSYLRKAYKSLWISNKRKLQRLEQRRRTAILQSPDSECSEDSASHSNNWDDMLRVEVTNSDPVDEANRAETNCVSNLSSEAEEDTIWNIIDSECDKLYDSSESDSDCEIEDLRNQLQTWAIKSAITHSQLNGLLPILKQLYSSLPVDARTLLKTPVINDIHCTSLSGGDYVYMDVQKGMDDVFANRSSEFADLLGLQLTMNIDGVPLFNSSNYSLWPILCSVANISPQPVLLWHFMVVNRSLRT